MGNVTKYRPEMAKQAEIACRFGATDDDLASLLNVSTATVNNWRIAHAEFAEALKAGREISDNRVERSLFQCAVGYTYEEEKAFMFQGNIIKETIKQYAQPQTSAQIFWLKNRQPDKWRDVQKHELGRAGEFDQVSDDKLLALIKEETQVIEGELVEASAQN
jgi:hypothetical protein